ncbi:MAG: hypothetical protein QOI45_3264, partial [Thermoleophilaceae bacterium]|nr:hypothetical protein [Thermoleophilaceae bacterium]
MEVAFDNGLVPCIVQDSRSG